MNTYEELDVSIYDTEGHKVLAAPKTFHSYEALGKYLDEYQEVLNTVEVYFPSTGDRRANIDLNYRF